MEEELTRELVKELRQLNQYFRRLMPELSETATLRRREEEKEKLSRQFRELQK